MDHETVCRSLRIDPNREVDRTKLTNEEIDKRVGNMYKLIGKYDDFVNLQSGFAHEEVIAYLIDLIDDPLDPLVKKQRQAHLDMYGRSSRYHHGYKKEPWTADQLVHVARIKSLKDTKYVMYRDVIDKGCLDT